MSQRSASRGSIVALGAWLALGACGADEPRTPAPAESSAEATPAVAEQIEVLVPELVDAVQGKQPVFVMDHVARDFKETRGLDYFDVQSLVETYAFHREDVGARLESVSITPLDGDKRRVEARVSFALGQRLADGAALPPEAVTYALDLVFEKRDTVWQAVSGSYRRE